MNIVVNEDLKAYIDPLSADERAALERSLLAEGCRDALVLWGELLVDGHNRFSICQQHNIPFHTTQSTLFQSLDDVHLWMIDQHLGRRSVSDYQRGVLALRQRAILEARQQAAAPARQSREELARSARLSSGQVGMIEKIQKQAAPAVVAAVKAGSISLNAAAALASLPVPEQEAAALGGREELQQAAKRVRETKKRAKVDGPQTQEAQHAQADDSVPALKARIAVLVAENAELRAALAAINQS